MRTVHTVFEQVAVYGRNIGKCGCGRQREHQRRFYQTLNPWNCNATGVPKTRDEILAELRVTLDAWRREPITCARCLGR
jgi:hypothetical protein